MLISINTNKEYIYILIFMGVNIILTYINKYLSNKKKLDYFIDNICNIFLIFIFFIEKINSKRKRNSIQSYSYQIKKIFFIKYNYILILSLIFSSIYYHNIYLLEKIKEIEYFIIIILFLMTIEIIFFNKQFYSHQIISIIIICVIFLYHIIKHLNTLKLYYLIIILQYYSESFSCLLMKYLNDNYFINIYFLAFIHGIFGLIQLFYQNNIIDSLKISDKYYIILLYFIAMYINNFLYYKIISKLGPIHAYMSDYISFLIFEKIFIEKLKISDIIMITCIISSLIYLEIIILNFCNLNKNIKRNIEKRSYIEINHELADTDYDYESDNYTIFDSNIKNNK